MTGRALDGRFLIDCCRDGTLTYRPRRSPPFNGAALPVFSVDTPEEAYDLIVLVGKLQYDEHPDLPGRPWYRLTWFSGNVDDLPNVTSYLAARFAERYRVAREDDTVPVRSERGTERL